MINIISDCFLKHVWIMLHEWVALKVKFACSNISFDVIQQTFGIMLTDVKSHASKLYPGYCLSVCHHRLKWFIFKLFLQISEKPIKMEPSVRLVVMVCTKGCDLGAHGWKSRNSGLVMLLGLNHKTGCTIFCIFINKCFN